jgi:hypothetical protein
MKKLLLFILVLTLYSVKVRAQFNAPDSKDKSSFLNQPSSVGIELEGGKLNVDFNNIKSQHSAENKWLVGVRYKGNAENGISQLINSGDMVFGNEINGFLGYSFTTSLKEEMIWVKLLENMDSTAVEHIQKAKTSIKLEIYKFKKESGLSGKQINMVYVFLFNESDTTEMPEFSEIQVDTSEKSINDFFSESKLNSEQFKKVKVLLRTINRILVEEKAFNDSLTETRIEYNIRKYEAQSKSLGKSRITVFINGGVSGHKFSLIESQESGLPGIQKIKFRGGKIGIGANIRLNGKNYIGLLYNIDWVDNFPDLNKRTSSFTDRDTIDGKFFNAKTELTAYDGIYQKFQKHTIGFDFMNQISFSDLSRIALNFPYIRCNSYSGLKDAKSTFDFGVSANFYQTSGHFLFGLFAELEDFANSNDSQYNTFSRLSFGFRVNYSLFTDLGN